MICYLFCLCSVQACVAAGSNSCPDPVFDVPAEAAPHELTARQELESYLSKAVRTGIGSEGESGLAFHVGNTDFARTRGLGSSAFADEEWAYRSFGRDIVLNGGGTRGCLYAVYHFLEEQCGVRWWADGDEDVPVVESLDLPALDRRGRPFFASREIYRGRGGDVRTLVRNRLNGGRLPAEYGGSRLCGPPAHCHTWDQVLPFTVYGAAHPEFFSLIGGRRVGGQGAGQLCLTASGLVDFYAARLEELIAQGAADARKAGVPPPVVYDISQNDNDKFCQCADCRREWSAYGSSGYQLRFVNAVAEKVGRCHPELTFTTLAYVTGEAVPKGGVRAASNVVVRLCNTRQNMAAGLFEPDSGPMAGLIRDWKGYAKSLGVWEYAITFDSTSKGYPFASEYYVFEKFRFYAENGVTGLFIEQEDPEKSDLYPLKFHLMARALEDPTADSERTIKDFYQRYFGPAAHKVAEARRLLDRLRRERRGCIEMFESVLGFGFVHDEDASEMLRLYDEAEVAVRDDPNRLKRVREARSSVDRLVEFRSRTSSPCPPEKGISDVAFYDFPVRRDGIWHGCRNAHRLVESSVSPEGLAYEIDLAKNDHYRLPFAFGVYDTKARKLLKEVKIEKPTVWNAFAWYELKGVTFSEKNPFYVYLTRAWDLQLSLAAPAFAGKTFDIRVRLNFTGSESMPGPVLADRLVLVPRVSSVGGTAAPAVSDGERALVMPDVFGKGESILFIGDSITHGGRMNDMNHYLGHGYQAEIAMRYLAYRPELRLQFENRGISGNTSSNLVARWAGDAVPCEAEATGEAGAFGWEESKRSFVPDVLNVLVGVNDFHKNRVAVDQYERNLRFMVTNALAAKPSMRIVLCEPFKLPQPEDGTFPLYQRAAVRVASDYGCVFVPFQSLFSERLVKINPNVKYWFWDSAHPTYAAHMMMADFWLSTVKSAWANH